MSPVSAVEAARPSRRETLLVTLRGDFGRLLGVPPETLDPGATFIELGADSMLLLRASQMIADRFSVKVPFRRLMEEVTTLEALAAHLDGEVPAASDGGPSGDPEPAVAPPPADAGGAAGTAGGAAPVEPPPAVFGPPSSGVGLESIFARQIDLMRRQLKMLAAPAAPPPATPAQATPAQATPAQATPAQATPAPAPRARAVAGRGEVYVPHQPIEPGEGLDLAEGQRRHVEELVARLGRRMAGSKERTQRHRRALADSRNSSRFRLAFKELCFPLLVERGEGARVWDVDGNEYVDLTMGFGALLFGHSPPFVQQALREEVERGVQLGPQSRLAGEVAELVRRLTGVERVSFFNSGTEAVMTALRLARTVTGRDRVAMFSGSYHGTFDGVLARASTLDDDDVSALPMAPGVPPGMVGDVRVFEYGSPRSLEALERIAPQLAGILIEPRQTRRPDFSLGDFLERLRTIADRSGAALIFDEVVTGFRTHPGGAQALFSVTADVVTYGKAAGAGLPLGIVAGKARYLDAVDGGDWQYGDASIPGAETTMVRGTFFKHPLVMAGARAALSHLLAEGPELQRRLDRRTEGLAARLQEVFDRRGVAVRVPHFSSLFLFEFPAALRAVDWDLFFYHLLEQGVYVWENRVCYLSTAHTDADLDRVVAAVAGAVEAMQAGGFLAAGTPSGGGSGPSRAGGPGSGSAAGATGVASGAAAARRVALTAGQRELLFLQRLDEEAARAYNEALKLRIEGPLGAPALIAALGDLVARHDALRAAFDAGGEGQTIHPAVAFAVPRIDLAALPPEPRRGEAGRLAAGAARHRFDLGRPPLFAARLLELAPERHDLVLVLPHLVTDGWSNGVLLRDLAERYAARREGRPPRLGAVRRLDDLVAGYRHEESASSTSAEDYWRRCMTPLPEALELPADHPRPAVRGYAGAVVRRPLGQALSAGTKAFGRARGITLLPVLLAAFTALLHRLSGQRDLVAGAFSAGQTWAAQADGVGYFVSLLPLRSRPERGAGLAAHAEGLHRQLLDALDHRGYPLSRLVETLGVEHDPSRPPLVPAVLNLDPPQAGPLPLGPARATIESVHNGGAKFDLGINAVEADGELWLDWELRRDLFDRSTVERWAGHLAVLLEGALDEPDRPLATLPLLAAAQRHQVRVEWNPGASPPPPEGDLDARRARQARRSPAAVAVIAADGTEVSYAELDRRIDSLAAELRRRGVGPEVVVGLLAERSPAAVVALLAVLRAGGAYLPLGADLPPDRMASMLADARPALLVVEEGLEARLPGGEIPVMPLGRGLDDLPAAPAAAAASTVGDRARAAYVLFTSGSTGRPKGVVMSHAGILNRLDWMQAAHPLRPGDRVLLKTPLTFDASIWELCLPLMTGATVVLAAEGAHRDPAELARTVTERGVTVLQLVPSLVPAYLAQPLPAAGSPLRRLFCGGEALASGVAGQAAERLGVEVVNLYGPTEAAIDVVSQPFRPSEPGGWVPLGRPLPNLRVHVVDGEGEPVPPGVAGELVVGGVNLARGYARRPARTAERFVPDPLSQIPGERLYRTGDRVRRRADGVVEYLGRLDHQVKLRGVRIEPGEVESALADHPQVREAAVAVCGTGGEAQMVAFLVAAPGGGVAAAQVRRFLRRRLPEAMVPAEILEVEALPRTPGGKLDRRALVTLRAEVERPVGGGGSPRTPTEAAGGRDLGRSPGAAAHLGPRQLLRSRRPLAARPPAAGPHRGRLRRPVAAAGPLRSADRGRARGGGGGGAAPRSLAARGAAGHRRPGGGRPPPVVRAAAALVPPPARAGQPELQPPRAAAGSRGCRARPGGAGPRAVGAAPRRSAHRLPGGGGRYRADPAGGAARAGGPAGGGPDRGRPHRRPRRRPGRRPAAGPPRLRPGVGAAAARPAAAPAGPCARAPPGVSPHRLRRLVPGGPAAGARHPAGGSGAGGGPARLSAGAVRRLRPLATPLAPRGRHGPRDRLLA